MVIDNVLCQHLSSFSAIAIQYIKYINILKPEGNSTSWIANSKCTKTERKYKVIHQIKKKNEQIRAITYQ